MSFKYQNSCIFPHLFAPQQEALEMEYFIQKLVSCKYFCYMFMIGNLKITCLPKWGAIVLVTLGFVYKAMISAPPPPAMKQ